MNIMVDRNRYAYSSIYLYFFMWIGVDVVIIESEFWVFELQFKLIHRNESNISGF